MNSNFRKIMWFWPIALILMVALSDVSHGAITNIGLTAFEDDMVVQRDTTTTGSLSLAGVYAGTEGANEVVQAMVTEDGTSTPVLIGSSSWTTVDSSPSGGVWSGTLSGIPQGQEKYNIDVRVWDTVLETQTFSDTNNTEAFMVGINVCITGQSQATNFLNYQGGTGTDTGYTVTTAGDDWAFVYNGTWNSVGAEHGTLADGIGIHEMTNLLADTLTVPVGIIYSATGGQALLEQYEAGGNGFWLDTTAGSDYDDIKTYLQTHSCQDWFFLQGEQDAAFEDISYFDYYNGLEQLYRNIRTDVDPNQRFHIAQIGKRTGGGSDYGTALIQKAQRDFANANDNVFMSTTHRVLPTYDDVHINAHIWPYLGKWMAEGVLHQIDPTIYPYYQGGFISHYTVDSTTQLTVYIKPRGNNSLTSGAITGFEVWDSDGTELAVTSQVLTNSGKNPYVTITLTSAIDTDDKITVSYMRGGNPDSTTPIYDSYALAGSSSGFPVEPLDDIPVREGISGSRNLEGLRNIHQFDRKESVSLSDEIVVYDPQHDKYYKASLNDAVRNLTFSDTGLEVNGKTTPDYVRVNPDSSSVNFFADQGIIRNEKKNADLQLIGSDSLGADVIAMHFEGDEDDFKIGIGTTDPKRAVDLYHPTVPAFALHNAATGTTQSDGGFFGLDSIGRFYFWNYEPQLMYFGNGGSIAMQINSNNQLGVNFTAGLDGMIHSKGKLVSGTEMAAVAGESNGTGDIFRGNSSTGTKVFSVDKEGGVIFGNSSVTTTGTMRWTGSEMQYYSGGWNAFGDITSVGSACNSGACNSITIADGQGIDMSSVTVNSALEGLFLPRDTTDCVSSSGIGQSCWDTTDDELYVGNGTKAIQIAKEPVQCSDNTPGFDESGCLHSGSGNFAPPSSCTTGNYGTHFYFYTSGASSTVFPQGGDQITGKGATGSSVAVPQYTMIHMICDSTTGNWVYN